MIRGATSFTKANESLPSFCISEQRLIGRSAAFASIKEIAASVAARRCTVLILGETGTGKEMLARHIHLLSDRAAEPFVPVDCAAVTDSLFESELFGHVKGAFTGALRDSLGIIRAAEGGTLFLDEIGELNSPLQAKLLRVLQERQVLPVGAVRPIPVNIRIIVATNKSLQEMVANGQFREDLFFRISVVVLTLPPLRERADDIIPLANHFLKVQADLYDEPVRKLSPKAVQILRRYPWPGNIRELANVIEHAHTLARNDIVEIDDMPSRLVRSSPVTRGHGATPTLQEIEKLAIVETLKRTDYCKAAASRSLGINVKRLNRMIKRLGIQLT